MRRRDCKAPRAGALRRRGPAAEAVLALVLLLGGAGGCSGPLLTFGSGADAGKDAAAEPVSTGSIAPAPVRFGPDLGGEDWRRAHAALSVALDPQGNGHPVKWDNPETRMRGSVDPTGLPYVVEDVVCRDFLTRVIAPAGSRFLRGTGCRPSGGAWELRRVRSVKG